MICADAENIAKTVRLITIAIRFNNFIQITLNYYFLFAGAAAGAGAATTLSKRALRAISFCKLSIAEMMNFTCE